VVGDGRADVQRRGEMPGGRGFWVTAVGDEEEEQRREGSGLGCNWPKESPPPFSIKFCCFILLFLFYFSFIPLL